MWFRAVLSVFSNFLQEKLKERIEVIPKEMLPQRLPAYSIPESLGGTLKVDHLAWLNKCLTSYSLAESSNCNGGTKDFTRRGDNNSRRVESSTFDQQVGLRNEGSCTVMEFIEHMMKLQRKGIKIEFVNLKRQAGVGSFQSARQVHLQLLFSFGHNDILVKIRTTVMCAEFTRIWNTM